MMHAPPYRATHEPATGLIVIRSAAGKPVAVVDEANPEIAEFIVAACNAHADTINQKKETTS